MTEKQKQFVEQIATAAKKIAPEFGIKVISPVIAQAILESGWGTSNKAMYNNFFGLKYREGRLTCHSGTFVDGSKEQNPDGSYVAITDQWFKFNTLEDGVRGYFQFINIDRYKNLKGITDPKKYLETIKADGYATSLAYVDNVYRVITTNNLTIYDQEDKPMATKKFKVHLDPGHYGSYYNRSTTNKKYYESNMNWTLTHYLKAELEALGIEVTLSRTEKDANPSLYERGYGAKGCNLFLSLHSNACSTESVDYPVVYRGIDKTAADEFGLKLAQLIEDLMNTKQKGRTKTRKNSAGTGEYYGVLRGARAAGLTYYYIVEHSFHTNAAATEWLLNDNNLKALAKKEAALIAEYFGIKKEEVKKEEKPAATTSTVKKYYRVRKSWKDSKSQIGAYTVLENAKKACKEGYTVYDWNGKAVYTNTPKKRSNEEIAREVIQGKWGNGSARRIKLTAAGYNYSEIQKLVNKLLK